MDLFQISMATTQQNDPQKFRSSIVYRLSSIIYYAGGVTLRRRMGGATPHPLYGLRQLPGALTGDWRVRSETTAPPSIELSGTVICLDQKQMRYARVFGRATGRMRNREGIEWDRVVSCVYMRVRVHVRVPRNSVRRTRLKEDVY